MSIKRLYAILLVLVLLATGVGTYTAQARPNAATTLFTIPLTADVVINGADGGEGFDGDGSGNQCYLTQAAAIAYSGAGTPNGINDNGLYPAGTFNLAVQLAVNNANNGINASKNFNRWFLHY